MNNTILETYVKAFNPKPKFTLKWDVGNGVYSEGEIEDLMLRLIATNPPEQYMQAIKSHLSWNTFYHLTHVRRNILNWYPFEEEADLLEIGCGLGAITGMLCDRCATVTSVELSKRRATAALLRCREKENLEIIVGNLNDIEFEKKFDYITLIGVFEYQGEYTNSDRPFHDFLQKVKSLLKPGGVLLIAIENQYGLKYWCGAREDHSGIPFDGINQYHFSGRGVRTFSKNQLERIIKESGFKNTYFYYPQPDYKLPTIIYSQDHLPETAHMQYAPFYYIPDNLTLVAEERELYKDLIENNVFEFFSNSFLVECSDTQIKSHVTFASMSTNRQNEYQTLTAIIDNETVMKIPLKAEAEPHIRKVPQTEEILSDRGLNMVMSKCKGGYLEAPYTDKQTFEKAIVDAVEAEDKETLKKYIGLWYDDIMKSSDTVDGKDNIIFKLGLDVYKNENEYGPVLKTGYIDLTVRNAFMEDGKLFWIDQEWVLDNVPASFIISRGLKDVLSTYSGYYGKAVVQEVLAELGLELDKPAYIKLEEMFSRSVLDYDHIVCLNNMGVSYDKPVINSIKRLVSC